MFHVSLLEQDIIRKRRMNKFIKMPEFKPSNNKKYKVKAIQDGEVYIKEANGHLLRLYYLIVWKGYLEEENTWKLSLAVIYLWKIVSILNKDHPEKLIVTSASLDFAPLIAKPTIQLPAKWK